MRVLITGPRDWEDRAIIWLALDRLWDLASGRLTLVHGACPTGVDKHADDWGRSRHGVVVERHSADWNKYGRAAGPRRNQEMVDLGADVVLVPKHIRTRGTADCARRAKAAGLHIMLYGPEILKED